MVCLFELFSKQHSSFFGEVFCFEHQREIGIGWLITSKSQYNNVCQEHLVIMGVPAYEFLAIDTPFPCFDFASMTPSAVKQLAGNDTRPVDDSKTLSSNTKDVLVSDL